MWGRGTPGKHHGGKAPWLRTLPPAGEEREAHEASGNDNFPHQPYYPRPFRIRHAKTRLNCAVRLGDSCFVYFACSHLYVLPSYFVILGFFLSDFFFLIPLRIIQLKAINIYLPLASYIQVVSRYQNATAIISSASHPRIFYLSTSACLYCGR